MIHSGTTYPPDKLKTYISLSLELTKGFASDKKKSLSIHNVSFDEQLVLSVVFEYLAASSTVVYGKGGHP